MPSHTKGQAESGLPEQFLTRLEDRYPVRAERERQSGVALPWFIDFIRENGKHRTAFALTQLLWIDSANPGCIVFHFSSHTVTVIGVRLESLYDEILSHARSRVEAMGENDHQGGPGDPPYIETIKIARTENRRVELDDLDVPIDPEDED